MTIEEKALLYIIRQSFFPGSEEAAWVDKVDKDTLFKEAELQAVLGIVTYDLSVFEFDNRWQLAQLRQKASYIQYCHAEDELNRVLNNANIPFVILKGNSAAYYYTVPECRSMGDIDFIVPSDRFKDACNALNSSGYIWDHESKRHIVYKKDGVCFELHSRFSHDDIDIEDYISSGLKSPDFVSIYNHSFPMLPKLANGLVLLDHMRNHLKTALGLRQVIDWMMYVYSNLNDEFWHDEFCKVAEEKKMAKLAIVSTRMCQIYLGLPNSITWCNSANVDDCDRFIECLFLSGNFGRKNGKGYDFEKVSTNIKREGFFHWLQYAGEFNWKAFHKHNWLRPLCWLYQLFRYAKQGLLSGRKKKDIRDDFIRSKERYELLKRLDID